MSESYNIIKLIFHTMDDITSLNRIWILSDKGSPWKQKDMPQFLDFTSPNQIIVRGLGDNSSERHSYKIGNGILTLDNQHQYRIVGLSDKQFVIENDGQYFSYYALTEISTPFNINDLKHLSKDKSWAIGADNLTFTKELETTLFDPKSKFYVLVSTQGTRKYFGSYFIDSYKGHVFLHTIIPNHVPIEKTIELVKINAEVIECREIDDSNKPLYYYSL